MDFRKRDVRIKELLPVLLGLIVIAVVVVIIPQAVKYAGKAKGFNANLVVNYEGILGETPRPWRNIAQGGEEPKDMIGPVADIVKGLQPEYIRLDHIYDAFKVVKRDGDRLAYDWSGLDGAVDSILKTGAKPMLSLTYMPEAISKSDMLDLPRDWNDWGNVVQATIEHYSGRDQKNIVGVSYEVWNEPDLFGGYKTYGDKNYLVMYEVSARAAMRTKNVNRFEIGGPAVTALYQNWVEKIIKLAGDKNLRLDFVSWHRYTYDLEQFVLDVQKSRAWAEKIPALVNLKYYVTEWGHDSERNKNYDGMFGAIHTIAASRIMMGAIDRAFIFEVKDGPGTDKYWGDWGLLTHEKFGVEKKPRFRAVEFLNTLANTRLSVTGEGSWVKSVATMDGSGNVKTMLVNYDPSGSHSEGVPITFNNLPSGNFTYKRADFLGKTKEVKVSTTSATWKVVEYMSPNTATMLSLDF